MDFKVPNFDLPDFKVIKPVNTPAENTASEFYKKIVRMLVLPVLFSALQ